MKKASLSTSKTNFIKTGRACVMNEKEHILVNLGQREDGTPVNNMKI